MHLVGKISYLCLYPRMDSEVMDLCGGPEYSGTANTAHEEDHPHTVIVGKRASALRKQTADAKALAGKSRPRGPSPWKGSTASLQRPPADPTKRNITVADPKPISSVVIASQPQTEGSTSKYSNEIENALSMISEPLKPDLEKRSSKMRGIGTTIRRRVLYGTDWNPNWEIFERLTSADRKKIGHLARNFNSEFLKHQKLMRVYDKKLNALLQSVQDDELERVETHYIEMMTQKHSTPHIISTWADHHHAMVTNPALKKVRQGNGVLRPSVPFTKQFTSNLRLTA